MKLDMNDLRKIAPKKTFKLKNWTFEFV